VSHIYSQTHERLVSYGSKNRHHRNALCDVLLIYGEIFFILFIVMSRFGKSKIFLWQTSISHKIYSPVLTQQLDFMILWSNIRTSFNRSNAVCTSVCIWASFGSKHDKEKVSKFYIIIRVCFLKASISPFLKWWFFEGCWIFVVRLSVWSWLLLGWGWLLCILYYICYPWVSLVYTPSVTL